MAFDPATAHGVGLAAASLPDGIVASFSHVVHSLWALAKLVWLALVAVVDYATDFLSAGLNGRGFYPERRLVRSGVMVAFGLLILVFRRWFLLALAIAVVIEAVRGFSGVT